KASDKGQKPAPLFIWALLVVLVIAEGIGFSYMLSSWMASEASQAADDGQRYPQITKPQIEPEQSHCYRQ
ncbi:hypothetical protein, partial [Achromobacter xylosoxidans]|uniref:hypothetical protein n=1 Tax=Alcaligenes xylosoxydans xylosoxydans TaxID=85698 RepID=UPI001F110A06